MKMMNSNMLKYISAFADDAFEVGKPYHIRFYDENACRDVVLLSCDNLNKSAQDYIIETLLTTGVCGTFTGFGTMKSDAVFHVIIKGCGFYYCDLYIGADLIKESLDKDDIKLEPVVWIDEYVVKKEG
jgi:hypothetical protein